MAKRARRQRKRNGGLALSRLLALACLAAVCMLIGTHGGGAAYLLFWAVLFAVLLSLAHGLVIRLRLSAAFRVEGEGATHGERIRCALILTNDSPLPIPDVRIRMTDGKVNFPEGQREIACSLAPFEVKRISFTPICLHCGTARFGAERIAARDLLGLTERRMRETAALNVRPSTKPISSLRVLPPKDAERRRSVRSYFGETVPDGQLRPYQPGDDVRRLHWKASARQNQPIVRNLIPEPKSEIVLLPDARAALPEGRAGYVAEDSVLEGTLCISDYFLRQGMTLRVVPDQGRALRVFTPMDHLRLAAMCTEELFSGSVRPDEVLEQELAAGAAGRDYIILTWELDERFLHCVSRCIEHGARVTLVYCGDDAKARALASTERRLAFYQVTPKSDIFAVLGGEGGAV